MAELESREDLLLKIKELEDKNKKLNLMLQKDSDMKYGLRWIDVPEAFEKESENKIPILEEIKDKAIKTEDNKPTHILIEGDNYHALKCLNYTHKGKIGVIYIDPPYNTDKGFVYKDSRKLKEYPNGETIDKNHPLRHSAWLSFMNKRLELAKELLADDGLLFISIDDYEMANLKLLCDKVFGQGRMINCFIWQRNSSGKTEKDKFTVNSEYVLLYSKTSKYVLNDAYKPLAESSIAGYNRDDNDGRGKYASVSLMKPKDPGPETTYDYVDNTGKVWPCPPKGWRMVESKIRELENDNRLIFSGETLRVKDYWNERPSEGKRIDTLWNDISENTVGSDEVASILGKNGIFDNPKPTDLIMRCIDAYPSKETTVLDFFAGSGTTLHAVMKENLKDNGTRQCILVQMPEKTFKFDDNGNEIPLSKETKTAFEAGFRDLTQITYIRNKKVIEGYKSTSGTSDELFSEKITLTKLKKANELLEKVEEIKKQFKDKYEKITVSINKGVLTVNGEFTKEENVLGLGNSLKYYKTSFVGNKEAAKASDSDKIELAKKAGSLLSIGENTLEEIKSTEYYQIYTNGKNKFTGVYFTGNADGLRDFCIELETIRNKSRLNRINAYFYSTGNGEEFENEFDSLKNIRIKTIPEPILKIYRALNI